jgi:ribosomal peptide maturation radical SAM protein 1
MNMPGNNVDVCFVNMPYGPIIQPSMALGLLQAVVERDGFSAESVYANMLFTAEIGIQPYRLIIKTMSSDALRDWTFAHIAFPDFAPNHEEYLNLVIRRNQLYGGCTPSQFKEMIFAIREATSRFVDRLAERILEGHPRIIGCTSSMNQHVPSLAILKRIRELAPHVITLVGGSNCESVMGRTTHKAFPWVDFVVSGEADGLITPLIRATMDQGREIDPTTLPEGVFAPAHRLAGYPHLSTNSEDDTPRAVFPSLEDLPVPNFDDYFKTLKQLPKWMREMILPAVPIEASRGCWWGEKSNCSFCGLHHRSKRFRSKPASQVLVEIDTLYQRYGVDRIQAVDNIMDTRYFKSLLPELVRAPRPIRFFFDVRPNLNRDQVRLMREAGLLWIWAGIESLHDDLLGLMNKGVTSWQNIQFLKWCRQYGIYVGWNMMCDFPGEKDLWYEEMSQYLMHLSHLKPPNACTRVRFDRFSDYHNRAKDHGLTLMPAKLYRYIYPLAEEDLRNQVYFFEDEARAQNPSFAPLLKQPGIKALVQSVDEWTKVFYSKNRPVLSMNITPSGIRIRDTRPISVEPSWHLNGLLGKLYLSCESASSRSEVISEFEERGFPGPEVEEAIQVLLGRKLMLSFSDRLLALAIREPFLELPNFSEYPGGTLVSRSVRQRLEKGRSLSDAGRSGM